MLDRLISASRSRSSSSRACLGESTSLERSAATSSSRKEICVVRTLTSSSDRPVRALSSRDAMLTPSKSGLNLDPTYRRSFRNLAAGPRLAFWSYDPGKARSRYWAGGPGRRQLPVLSWRRVGECVLVLTCLGAFGRAAPALRRRHSVSQPPCGHQEAGVADHAMFRADGEPVDMPAPQHGFPGRRLIEVALAAQCLNGTGELRGGGQVAADQPARDKRARRGGHMLPGGEHVQHHAVKGRGRLMLARLCAVGRQVADDELPGRVLAAEVALDILPGDLGEVRPALVGDQQAGLAYCPQQPAGPGAV